MTTDSYTDSNFASLLTATATAYDERPEVSAYYRSSQSQPAYPEFSTIYSRSDRSAEGGVGNGKVNGLNSPSHNHNPSSYDDNNDPQQNLNQSNNNQKPVYSEESNKFDEIQRIIAAELSNLDHVQALQKANNHDNFQDEEESTDGKKSKKRKTTRFKGVFKCGKKWKAQIQAHGIQHYLGLFETEEEAARAYDDHARMILGVMKAKTNFPYNPEEAPLQPIQPLPVVTYPSPAKPSLQTSSRSDTEEESKQLGKRSYVGMKLRKQSGQKELRRETVHSQQPPPATANGYAHQNHPPQSSSYPSQTSATLAGKAMVTQSLVHVPMPLAQNSYVMNNIPTSYTAVMHPARFLNNEGFNSLIPITSIPPPTSSTAPANNSIDWSNHPYTPLEITGAYDHDPTTEYSPLPTATAQVSSSNNDDEPDWRDQIYYWTGILDYDDSLQSLTWKGRWLGSFTGKPSLEEFESSHNEFFYTSIITERNKVVFNVAMPAGGGAAMSLVQPLSGLYKGYYMMMENTSSSSLGNQNNGTGDGATSTMNGRREMERYHDKEFVLEFEPHSSVTVNLLSGSTPSSSTSSIRTSMIPVTYNVFGKGDSEFGMFILHGNYDAQSKVMNMCRQYIADTDLRCSMSMPQLKQYLRRSATESGFSRNILD